MPINNIFIIISLFVIWTIFGSFWWVLISRKWNKEWIKSIFFGRSKCTNCNKILGYKELIPVFSFLFQKWKCRSCWAKLSHYYWIVEVLMWFVFVLTYLFFPYISIWELVFWLIINWSLTLLLIFDIQHYELHFPMWIFLTIISAFFAFWKLDLVIVIESVFSYISMFLIIYIFSKYYAKFRFNQEEWFWIWDVYLSMTIWILSGFVFYYNFLKFWVVNLMNIILIYVILSSVVWLVYALILKLFFGRHKQIIPFLPSMIVAFWVLLFCADSFINIFW